MRTVTVLRPDIEVTKDNPRPWLMSDAAAQSRFGTVWVEEWADRMVAHYFITVPLIDTHGQYKVRDLVPVEQLAALAAFTNRLEKQRKGRRNG